MKDVSVIFINDNSSSYSMYCVNSILDKSNDDLNYEIIIVDNNSNELDYDRLSHFCEEIACVSVIRSSVTLGVSEGHMLGAEQCDGKYIYFLSNHVAFLNDNLRILYFFMRSNREVALCTGQMYDSNKNFHPSFNSFPGLIRSLFGVSLLNVFNPLKYPDRKSEFTFPIQVDFVTGAAMFVDGKKFKEIGGFDTNYFLHCGEEDIAMRFKKANYPTFLVPEAKFIYHMPNKACDIKVEKEFYKALFYYYNKFSVKLEYRVMKILLFLKNVKRLYKGFYYLEIALFVLKGAKTGESLRHK
ncbi:glycosyltransferase [Fulvivirga sp. M361]|uniref:glycosyltransferase n=1 Tax=Fulvivirga sp. M361 TaxID=2594266 RepID=UPI002101F1E2|nr:glycosyltransferase [Fulvivirga sp. M361]